MTREEAITQMEKLGFVQVSKDFWIYRSLINQNDFSNLGGKVDGNNQAQD